MGHSQVPGATSAGENEKKGAVVAVWEINCC